MNKVILLQLLGFIIVLSGIIWQIFYYNPNSYDIDITIYVTALLGFPLIFLAEFIVKNYKEVKK